MASRSAGKLALMRSESSTEESGVMAPITIIPFSWRTKLNSWRFFKLIKNAGSTRRCFIRTIKSVPPAITLASSPWVARNSRASSRFSGSRYSKLGSLNGRFSYSRVFA
jgi:hypothetical protein